jgi:hypothetical protein
VRGKMRWTSWRRMCACDTHPDAHRRGPWTQVDLPGNMQRQQPTRVSRWLFAGAESSRTDRLTESTQPHRPMKLVAPTCMCMEHVFVALFCVWDAAALPGCLFRANATPVLSTARTIAGMGSSRQELHLDYSCAFATATRVVTRIDVQR